MSGRVPPSSRAGKGRPGARSRVTKLADLAERFTGHDAEILGTIKVPAMPTEAMVIGELDGVLYTTVRDGQVEHYIHRFAAKDRPLLAVDASARQLLIVGGGYRMTELGIVDDSDREHANAR